MLKSIYKTIIIKKRTQQREDGLIVDMGHLMARREQKQKEPMGHRVFQYTCGSGGM
jgi:ribosomal protein L14